MDQQDKTTAYDLAVRHRIDFWGQACPLCGDTTFLGRQLTDGPGSHGEAIYLCSNCQTRFTRIWFAVAHAVKVAL